MWKLILYLFVATSVSNAVDDVFQGPFKCTCNNQENGYKDSFSRVLSYLHCCQGSPYCGRNALSDESPNTDLLLCISEKSCIVEFSLRDSYTCDNITDKCFTDSLITYNISNVFKEWSLYNCILVRKEPSPLCLIPACKTFGAVERNCFCKRYKKSCICYSGALKEQVIPYETDIATYAVFLSFGEDFVVVGSTRFSTITILVILFCSLFLLGLLGVLLKGIHVFTPVLSSGHTSCTTAIQKLCCRSPSTSNSTFTTTRQPCTTPKAEGDEISVSVQNEHVLPTYEQAVSRERTVYTVELPPTYAAVTT